MNKPIIDVKNLNKTFQVKQKSPGFIAGLRSIIWPEYKTILAVDNISFSVDAGESIAFIGPNGAGKSTTIKMLTGILFPTSGNINILGYDPHKDRSILAYKIGTVFGQKSQLWYHLPPLDTFYLLCRIYELKREVFQERLTYLVNAFEIRSFLNTPVRKLSLGQRMRCELVASLLHKPPIIFLDEPTIGLDVIAKQMIRDVLLHLNQREGVSIFLTSHDAGDIEALTKRTIIINHGTMIFDGSTQSLKKDYLTTKVIELVLEQSVDTFNFPEGKVLERNKHAIKIEVDTSVSTVEKLLAYALENFTVIDISITQTPLEEIIGAVYKGQHE